ncbi:uncharacterized protein [Triticum aestivum]|uniref:uncharacterized protein isoform X2 n=1 Tax=Triticum aestivum TaxID=4565 RepID=UPI001D007A0E|nr:uncharacterized protein LOC123156645 isoform X2 [Triticum aestivum]
MGRCRTKSQGEKEIDVGAPNPSALPVHGEMLYQIDMRSGSGVVHQRCDISLLAMQSIGAGTFRCGVGFRGHLLCVVPIVLGCGCAHSTKGHFESLGDIMILVSRRVDHDGEDQTGISASMLRLLICISSLGISSLKPSSPYGNNIGYCIDMNFGWISDIL